MIRVKVGDKSYDVKFTYERIIVGKDEKGRDVKIPHDTQVDIYPENEATLVSSGRALLHPNDWGKFRYKLGRKIALKHAVAGTNWKQSERAQFWAGVMPFIKE